jgi:hypothetical protein
VDDQENQADDEENQADDEENQADDEENQADDEENQVDYHPQSPSDDGNIPEGNKVNNSEYNTPSSNKRKFESDDDSSVTEQEAKRLKVVKCKDELESTGNDGPVAYSMIDPSEAKGNTIITKLLSYLLTSLGFTPAPLDILPFMVQLLFLGILPLSVILIAFIVFILLK